MSRVGSASVWFGLVGSGRVWLGLPRFVGSACLWSSQVESSGLICMVVELGLGVLASDAVRLSLGGSASV